MHKTTESRSTTPTSSLLDPKTSFKGRSIAFYHPNSKGTGSALRLEPKLNRDDGDRYNCFFLEMAAQKTPMRREQGRISPATFEWSNKITVKLNFMDIAEMLTVLEGRAEKMGGERSGLYHASGNMNTLISLQKNSDNCTYYLGLSCKRSATDTPLKVGISLSDAEATGIRCLFQTGLFFITFSSLLYDHRSHPGSTGDLSRGLAA